MESLMKDSPALDLEELPLTVEGKTPGFLSSAKAYRAQVPGGWLVFSWDSTGMNGVTFYPDPRHAWSGRAEDGEAT
jgi:hypothetical protein